jgi:anti-sigma regulatory factor (Ser/Thr protein kinase)
VVTLPFASQPTLGRAFGASELRTLREDVAALAAGAGLHEPRLADFVLAVNEVMTNVVRHGGGRGRLRLWLAEGRLRCEIADHGPGIPPSRLANDELPPGSATGGRGLWLARRLCDAMTVDTGPDGTTIRLFAGAPATA